MSDALSLNDIDALLCKYGLQTRELIQKKNEVNYQIKVSRADIVERKSHIEKMKQNINKLEEDSKVKQRTLSHNKENAKSMKTTLNLLHQFEQTLTAELETRKTSYTRDLEAYEERIAKYRQTFQSYKEYYHRNPLAQTLLMIEREKEEIECRIKACDDQIIMKQEELDSLTGPAVGSSSPEKPSDGYLSGSHVVNRENISITPSKGRVSPSTCSVTGHQPVTEAETQPGHVTEENNDSAFDVSSLHLNQTMVHHNTSVEVTDEEICEIQSISGNTDLSSYQQVDEQNLPNETHTKDDDNTTAQDRAWEQQFTLPDTEQAVEEEMEEGVVLEEEQTINKETHKNLTTTPQPSEKAGHQSSPRRMKAHPPVPAFPFNFSPGSSPHQGASDTTSPAFLFSMNSAPSTPGFFGFGLDMGSQDEDSALPFSSSFFSDKKNPETKSSFEFLFDQPEKNEDFQFSFTPKSPENNTSEKDKAKDDFTFSFNF